MGRKRYLFFDIDGTLAAGGYGETFIPTTTRMALDKVRDAGHFLAITTGRSQAMAIDMMRDMGFTNMVSDGGYGVTIDGELLGITPLPRNKVIELVRECEQKGFPWGLQVDNSVTRLVPDERFMDFTHDAYMGARVVEGLDPEDFDQIYKAYVACYAPDEQQLESLRDLPWYRFHKEYLFVEPADKAFGIRKIMDHMGACYADAIVFGDALNDVSMFVDDWYKVAMGNACDEVKALADYVTTDVLTDGIWNACVHLGLFDPVDEA